MIDESMDKEQMAGPIQPWEFRAKPAWQRLIIMVGGVVVNFILGFLLFAMVFTIWGKDYISTENAKYGISTGSLGKEAGLQDGDKILQIGDLKLDRFNKGLISQEIVINGANVMKVERDGQLIDISLSDNVKSTLSKNKGADFIGLRTPFQVEKVTGGSEAEKAGMKKNSIILTVNGQPSTYFHEFKEILAANKEKEISMTILQENGDTTRSTAMVSANGTLGFQSYGEDKFFEMSNERYGFFEAIPEGINEGVDFLTLQLKAFKKMFTGEISAKDNLGSVISIANYFDPSWDWRKFWQITAMLSIILGFFNILPIPALDGGYVMFLLYEIISGKQPSDKFMEVVNVIGFLLLISLMIFALGLDISRLFK
jgi:regulator of sigma E protease